MLRDIMFFRLSLIYWSLAGDLLTCKPILLNYISPTQHPGCHLGNFDKVPRNKNFIKTCIKPCLRVFRKYNLFLQCPRRKLFVPAARILLLSTAATCLHDRNLESPKGTRKKNPFCRKLCAFSRPSHGPN